MVSRSPLSRRAMLKIAAMSSAAMVAAACGATPTATPAPTKPPAPAATAVPTPVPQPKAPVTISYWHIWGGDRDKQLGTVLADFMRDNPSIKVEPLLLPNPGYEDKVVAALAGDPPDSTMIVTNEYAPAAKRGALKQVDDMMAKDGLTKDIWYPGIWSMAQWGGHCYGLPFSPGNLQMIFWSKDDFKQAGLDPEVWPEKWADMVTAAKKLTIMDGNNIKRLGYQPGGSVEWAQGVYRNGQSLLGDGTPEKVGIDNPRSMEALQFMMDLYDAMGGWDKVGAAMTGFGNQQITNTLIAGVASSIWSAVYTINVINLQKPDLNYKVGKPHHGPNGGYLDVTYTEWCNAIPAKSKHPDESWALVKYLSAGEGHRKFMVELQGRPASVRKYNEAPYDAAARKVNKYWDIVLEILNGKQVSYPVSDKLTAAGRLLTETFESVMLKQRKPAEALTWGQGEMVKLFKSE